MPDFQASVELPQTVFSVFDYVRRPRNLVKLLAGTTADFEYRVPEILEQGSQLEFRLRRYGMKIDVVLQVVDLMDQQRILLKQQKGPFHRWLHEYAFSELPGNCTRLTERVMFDAPTGFLGLFITNQGIMDQLQKRIRNGHIQLREQFGQAKA